MEQINQLLINTIPKGILREYKYFKNKYRYHKKSNAFKGSNVYCPCCDKFFAEFDGFKVDDKYHNINLFPNNLSQVVCPCCASMPRHRIICDYLVQHKEQYFTRGSKVLIFAPAYSIYLWFKRNKVKFISADLMEKTVDIKIDIQKIPFNGNEFNFISCDHVLEHVPDYKLAIAELFRVAKPGGIVEITVPLSLELVKTYEDDSIISYFDRAKAFGQFDHLRIFGRDLEGILKETGFEVNIVDGDNCDENIMPLTAPSLYDCNKIFICNKPYKFG